MNAEATLLVAVNKLASASLQLYEDASTGICYYAAADVDKVRAEAKALVMQAAETICPRGDQK